jgi:hypothetical protein
MKCSLSNDPGFVVRNFPYSETKLLQLKNSTNEKQDKVSIEGKMAGMGRGGAVRGRIKI